MKLYKFTSRPWNGKKLYDVEDFDVAEKPKTYSCKWHTVKKSEIGKISGTFDVMWLTENNPGVYLRELLKVNNHDIEKIESKLNDMKDKSKRIEEYLKGETEKNG